MPSFAELKAKASGITSAGVEKVQNARDRNTSVPMAKTNWDPYSGERPPPPPPPRSLVNQNTKPLKALLPPPSRTTASSTTSLSRTNSVSPAPPLPSRTPSSSAPPPARNHSVSPPIAPPRAPLQTKQSYGKTLPPVGPPPPIQRSTRPDLRTHQVAPVISVEPEIDWANLSPEDKDVFFSWLDEYFANFNAKLTVKTDTNARANATGFASPSTPFLAQAKNLASWTRTQVSTTLQGQGATKAFAPLSHPPSTEHGSAALDLAQYFAPTTVWVDSWYNSTNSPAIPPPIVDDRNHMYFTSSVTMGSKKTINVGALFSDLSVFWGTVDFITTRPADPKTTKRAAVYLPPPDALDQERLVEAHETYGETIALYAESFLGSGQVCARGECWDLANEALKYFQDYDYVPKPVPSIGRTHGHLIYEARAKDGGRMKEGRWRGGDNRIRRGDIVEWRRVRIALPGGFSMLGNPDHTAIIVADAELEVLPKDGEALSPMEVGIITVIEQSQGKLPEKREYDLRCLEDGEVWVYRPISMEVYLGLRDLSAVAPEGHERLKRS